MLFGSKPKGIYIEFTEHHRLLLKATTGVQPVVIEEFAECETSDREGWGEVIEHFIPKKAPNGLLQANCAVYPAKRLVRRASIEPKKLKEPTYLTEFAASQFRIEPENYALALLNATNGKDYDIAAAAEKDVMICGMPKTEIDEVQDHLLEVQVYPERLELGSLSTLGGLADYLKFKKSKSPIVVLELEMNATHSFILSADGVEASRLLPQGLNAMIPVVQKELGLKDEESARKLFFSNTFDFTGMGPSLIKRLLNELQSSIGFYEVQTGQSIGNVLCVNLPPKLDWLESTIAGQLGVDVLSFDLPSWLESRGITLSESAAAMELTRKWFGLLSLVARYDALETEQKE